MDDMDFGGGDLDMGGGDSGGFDMGGDSGGTDFGADSGGGDMLGGGLDDGGSSDLSGGSDDTTTDAGASDNFGVESDGENLNETSPDAAENDNLNTESQETDTETPVEDVESDNLNAENQEIDTENASENAESNNAAEGNDNLNAENQEIDTDTESPKDTENNTAENNEPEIADETDTETDSPENVEDNNAESEQENTTDGSSQEAENADVNSESAENQNAEQTENSEMSQEDGEVKSDETENSTENSEKPSETNTESSETEQIENSENSTENSDVDNNTEQNSEQSENNENANSENPASENNETENADTNSENAEQTENSATESGKTPNQEQTEEQNPETEPDKDFEIGGHRDMSLEEAQQYQQDGSNAFKESLPEDYKFNEEMTDVDKQNFVEVQDKFEAEVMNDNTNDGNISENQNIDSESVDNSVAEQQEEKPDAADYPEYDPEWNNPTYEQVTGEADMKQMEMKTDENGEAYISSEYGEAEATQHEDHNEFVKDFNENGAALADVTEATPEGLDSSEIAGNINDNDYLVEKETEFGENTGQAMQDMSGTMTETDRSKAESDNLAQQYEEIPEEPAAQEEQLDGQMEFDDTPNAESNGDNGDTPSQHEYGKYTESEVVPKKGFMAHTPTEQAEGKLDENLNPADENRIKNESGLPEQNNPTHYNKAEISEEAHIYESDVEPTEQLLYTDTDGNEQEAYRQVNEEGVSTGEYLDKDGNILPKEDIVVQSQEGGATQAFVSDGYPENDSYSGELKSEDGTVMGESTFTSRSDKSIDELHNDPMYSDLTSQGYSEKATENIVSAGGEWKRKQ